MRWLIAFLLMSSSALAETVTTTNVLPNLSAFTTSGSTTSAGSARGCSAGEFCTGNATAGGGTYTSTFDVPLTEDEVRRGFTLNSAVTVDSHPSNATLSTCTSVTQVGDCRDLFTLGVTLLDGGTVAKEFTHEVELDFTGERLFSFSDTMVENDFGILTGTLSLFGIDAGFHSGFFGPKFSDPSLTFTHERVVEQQILDQIVQNDVIAAAPPVQVNLPPPPVDLPPPPAAAPIVVAVAPQAPSEPPPPPEIAPIQIDLPPPPMEQQQQEVRAEAAIEAQIEQDIAPPSVEQPRSQEPETEPEPEQPQQSSEREPEREAQPAETQTQPQPSETEPEPESSVEPPAETREAQAPPKPKSRQEKVKAAAEKAVAKIAPSQRYSAASQTTTMVAMGMISPKIAAPLALVDTPGFFTGAKVPDGPSLVDRMQNYTLFGKSNGSHNALVELDWKR
jgi:hypothetical protein